MTDPIFNPLNPVPDSPLAQISSMIGPAQVSTDSALEKIRQAHLGNVDLQAQDEAPLWGSIASGFNSAMGTLGTAGIAAGLSGAGSMYGKEVGRQLDMGRKNAISAANLEFIEASKRQTGLETKYAAALQRGANRGPIEDLARNNKITQVFNVALAKANNQGATDEEAHRYAAKEAADAADRWDSGMGRNPTPAAPQTNSPTATQMGIPPTAGQIQLSSSSALDVASDSPLTPDLVTAMRADALSRGDADAVRSIDNMAKPIAAPVNSTAINPVNLLTKARAIEEQASAREQGKLNVLSSGQAIKSKKDEAIAKESGRNEVKRAFAEPKVQQNLASIDESSKELVRRLTDIEDKKDLGAVTGFRGDIPLIGRNTEFGWTNAAETKAAIAALSSQLGLAAILELKAASPTGSTGFGAMTEGEHKLLQQRLGNLSTVTNEKSLREEIAAIKRQVIAINERQRKNTQALYGRTEYSGDVDSVRDIKPSPPTKKVRTVAEIEADIVKHTGGR